MVCGTLQSEALACQATREQTTISSEQLEILQRFIVEGDKAERVRKYVILKVMRKEKDLSVCCDLWDQMIIFLALSHIKPHGTRFSPPVLIDRAWHEFILCTYGYACFCENAADKFIHHMPNALADTEAIPEASWFSEVANITRFLGGQVPQYKEEPWLSGKGRCSTDCFVG